MDATKLEEFRRQFPIFRCTNTGKYGWRRYLDCPDLRSCAFDTEEEATADRDSTIRVGKIDEENGQPY